MCQYLHMPYNSFLFLNSTQLIGESYDYYRKPRPGCWQFLVDQVCPEVDLSESIFVGDAAGRPATSSRKQDFADSDYKLALNVGVAFKTPEHFFEGSRDPLHCQLPKPRFHISLYDNNPEPDPDLFGEKCGSPEIVLLIAPAAR